MPEEKIDGLEALKRLLFNDDALIEHIIDSILFFNQEMVLKQTIEVCDKIKRNEAIPVRYTSNKAFFLQHAVKTTTPSFKSKSEALKFTRNSSNELFHRETKIRICIDPDGNYAPKRAILQYTKHKVSCGQSSTVTNYIIAHIWERTDNPLFFSLLWNYALIPCHCAFLTDKRDDSSPIAKGLKSLIKARSIELYDPNRIMAQQQDILSGNDIPSEEDRVKARKLISEDKIHFLPINMNEVKDDIIPECSE